VHLLTKEAVEMYLKKLAPGGIIIVNIANKYLNFEPVFGNLAEELGLASMLGDSQPDEWFYGDVSDLYACEWVLLARDEKDFGKLNEFRGLHNRARWGDVPRDESLGVWTDKYSNLLGIFDWKRREVREED
jgi:hypothetical protein